MRSRQLLEQSGYFNREGKTAWFNDDDIRLRDQCEAQAIAEIDSDYVSYRGYAPDGQDDVDWSVSPREGLRTALRERDVALTARDQAGEVADLAVQRLQVAETDLASYAGLDDEVDQYNWRTAF